MEKERFDTGKKPHLTVAECDGNLVIRGWDEPAVLVKGADCRVEQSDDGLHIASKGRLRLLVPTGSTLTLRQLRGDLVVKNVVGSTEIEDVAGDAVLVGLGDMQANAVHNDLSARRIEGTAHVEVVHGDMVAKHVGGLDVKTIHGDLSASEVGGGAYVGQVMGDISLRGVSGEVEITSGYRDANLRDVGGLVKVADIHGDIRLRGSLAPGKHSLQANGDVVLRWPEGELLNVVASASSIVNRLQFDELTESKESLTGIMDGAVSHVTISARGRAILKSMRLADESWEWEQAAEGEFDFAVDWEGIGERISFQVNDQIARIATDLEDRFGPEFSQKMAEKISKKAEWAANKAERAAERAMRRAERSMRRSGWRTAQRPQPKSATYAKKPATDEEQLKILKMVEQGIISVDEASMLLEALER